MIIDNVNLKVDDLDDIAGWFKVKSFPADYDVEFLNESPKKMIDGLLDHKLIIIDNNVANIYGVPDKENIVRFVATEDNKSMGTVLSFCEKLDKVGFRKKDSLVVIGGGITQDTCGMTAKLFRRGIKWTLVPTTLLAMCDSCIGGKAAVNHNAKNQLALFTSPTEVTINPGFMKTLDDKDLDCGLGEIVKLFALGGQGYVDLLAVDEVDSQMMYDLKRLGRLAKQALLIKKAVIEYDEFEKNLRKSLNYGHTFGHAIEAITNYTIPHGIAIIYGMYIVNKLFEENESFNETLVKFMDKDVLRYILSEKLEDMLSLTKKDKKNDNENLFLVRVPTNGTCVFSEVEVNDDFVSRLKNMS